MTYRITRLPEDPAEEDDFFHVEPGQADDVLTDGRPAPAEATTWIPVAGHKTHVRGPQSMSRVPTPDTPPRHAKALTDNPWFQPGGDAAPGAGPASAEEITVTTEAVRPETSEVTTARPPSRPRHPADIPVEPARRPEHTHRPAPDPRDGPETPRRPAAHGYGEDAARLTDTIEAARPAHRPGPGVDPGYAPRLDFRPEVHQDPTDVRPDPITTAIEIPLEHLQPDPELIEETPESDQPVEDDHFVGQPRPAPRWTGSAAVSLEDAGLRFGERVLWDNLNIEVEPGEFLTVLGPNGSGKTSLLRVLLGQNRLFKGTARIGGKRVGKGTHRLIGYIPQQRSVDSGAPVRGRDLVGLGLDGHRWGIGWQGRDARRRHVNRAIAAVGAQAYADKPVGLLSGGEQQRLRVAQALVGEPEVLLCDEPLLSLDIARQHMVSNLIAERGRELGAAVLFITHEINPVLPLTDRVLYLVDGRFRIGPVDEVMTSETLSELYQTDIEVLRPKGRIIVIGGEDRPDAAQSTE